MNRRAFLQKMMLGSAAASVPALAVGAMAMNKSEAIESKMNDFVLNSDHITIQNCNFDMNGHIKMQGNGMVITSCSFTMHGAEPAILTS